MYFTAIKKIEEEKERKGRNRTEEPGEATRKELKSVLRSVVSNWGACTANSHSACSDTSLSGRKTRVPHVQKKVFCTLEK